MATRERYAVWRRHGFGVLFAVLIAVMVVWPTDANAGEWLFDFGAGVPNNWGPEHQVAMNASGETALIFGFNGVRVSLRPAGGYFESPEWGGVLVSAGGIEGTTPDVAIDNRGDVVAVWEQYTDRHSIYEATKPAGGSFGSPVEVSSGSEEASLPSVAIDDAGEATVAWLGHSGAGAVVRAATAALGHPFSAPVGLSGEAGGVSDPRVTVNGGGDTIVSWELAGSQLEVMVRRAGTSWPANGAHDYGTVLGEVAVSSTPSVTIDSAGEVLVVWTAPGGISYAARAAPHMVLFGPAIALVGVDGSPSVALNEAGEAAMAWPDGRGVLVATAPPAGTFGTSEQLSSYFAPSATHISIGAAGNVAVEWEAITEEGSFGREGSFRTSTGTFAKRQGLGGGNLPEEGSLVVTSDSAGDMIGVWDTTDLHDMESMLYDAGPQLGGVSVPASGVVGQPLAFSIPSPLSVWRPLNAVTWNFGDGTTASGLSVAHVYAAPATYHVTVTATDAQHTDLPFDPALFPEYVGDSVSGTVTVTSAATAPARAPVSARQVQSLTGLSVKPTSFVASITGPSTAAVDAPSRSRSGAAVHFALTLPGRITFGVELSTTGIREGKKCLPPKSGAKTKHSTKCALLRRLGTFQRNGSAGNNSFHLTGRLNGKTLAAGTYIFTASTEGAHESSRVPFKIMRR